jgi:hypothetical protein
LSVQLLAFPLGLFSPAALLFKLSQRLATFVLKRGLCSLSQLEANS